VATIKTLSAFPVAVNTFFIFFLQIVLSGHKGIKIGTYGRFACPIPCAVC